MIKITRTSCIGKPCHMAISGRSVVGTARSIRPITPAIKITALTAAQVGSRRDRPLCSKIAISTTISSIATTDGAPRSRSWLINPMPISPSTTAQVTAVNCRTGNSAGSDVAGSVRLPAARSATRWATPGLVISNVVPAPGAESSRISRRPRPTGRSSTAGHPAS